MGESALSTRARSAARAGVSEITESARRLGAQWRPVVFPALVVWMLAAIVSTTLLHPFDVGEYGRYAHAALRAPLLHRLPAEYPAPALVVFLLPLVLPFAYPWAFACVAGVVLVWLVTSYEGSELRGWDVRAAGRLVIYLALGAVMVVAGRYDIFAAVAAFWAVRAATRERWSAAWTWASIGFVLKLFPAALWPVLVIAEVRAAGRIPWRRLWWIGSSFVVAAVIPAALNPGAALNVVHYYQHRPAEIGSIPAGLSLLVDFGGSSWVGSFHSANITNPWAGPIAVVVELGAVAGCLWTWWAQSRGRLSVPAASLATLTFVVLGSKVLSVQYLIWLMPLWALYRLRMSWLLASAANLVVFPYAVTATSFGYVPTHAFAVSLTLAFLARDLLIAAGTWSWLRMVYARGDEAAADRVPAPSVLDRRGALVSRR